MVVSQIFHPTKNDLSLDAIKDSVAILGQSDMIYLTADVTNVRWRL